MVRTVNRKIRWTRTRAQESLPDFATLPVLQGIGIPSCCGLPNECMDFLLVRTPQLWLKDFAVETGSICAEKKTILVKDL